jgi:hypothetical protein
MQSRDNDKNAPIQSVMLDIYTHECDALFEMRMQYEDEGFHARSRWCI